MTDHDDRAADAAGADAQDASSTTSPATAPIDRRGFIRRSAAAALGGTVAAAAAADAAQTPAAVAPAGSAQQLETRTQLALRWAGREPADWVRPRGTTDHNVVIVGAGQSGLSLAYGLKRKGIGKVSLIDRAAQGQTGIWRHTARMQQLRTPKTLAGLEPQNPSLGFRAWFESLNGPAAFDALDRIPRLAWADYLDWFQQTTGTTVRYGTRLVMIEPAGEHIRLHLEVNGQPKVETTRKLVLATGYAGAGGASIPDFLTALPSRVWSHSTGSIPADLKGKVVGVIGAGSNAFDASAVALEGGAAEVHMFNRRAWVEYQGGPAPAQAGPPADRGYGGPTEMNYFLPEVVRWRNYLAGERRVASVPMDSLRRAVAFKNFKLHLNASLADVAMAPNGQIVAKVGAATHRFDYLIAGTGYKVDLSAQPEFARIHDAIALWRHRYQPPAGEEHAGGASHPYLGPSFEFQARDGVQAPYLANIHCFNLAGQVSFGIPVGDVPSVPDHPRVIEGIARDLFVAGVDVAAHQKFVNLPQVAPDPSPYQSAVEGPQRSALEELLNAVVA
jgi:cation diffusion facilitator CzcD-associated flavoprotein CzcO